MPLNRGGQAACRGYIAWVVEGTCTLVVLPLEGGVPFEEVAFGDFVEPGGGEGWESWFVDGVVAGVGLLLVVIVFGYCDSTRF